MNRRRFTAYFSLLVGGVVSPFSPCRRRTSADDKSKLSQGYSQGGSETRHASESRLQPVTQAQRFLDNLSDEQKSKAIVAFDSKTRTDWHFFPKATRKGLPLMEMTDEQQAAAFQLLETCVSPEGFLAAKKVIEIEALIGRLEGDTKWTVRHPKKFYFTLFGSPAADERWGLSVEGHHLSLNFVFKGDAIINSTPQFYAANPARVQTDYEGFPKGLEILKAEQQFGFELVQSLSEAQLEKATLPGNPPREILTAGTPQPTIEPLTVGIAASELTEPQQDILRKLLAAYTSKMCPSVEKDRWNLIEKAGFNQIVFAWSGSRVAGKNHYYRVQGPTFLVEFINVQPDPAGNPANHIHCVWRAMTGDFDLPL